MGGVVSGVCVGRCYEQAGDGRCGVPGECGWKWSRIWVNGVPGRVCVMHLSDTCLTSFYICGRKCLIVNYISVFKRL